MADEIGSIRKQPLTQLREYISEVRVEMKRVTWPSKQEIYGTTVMVLLTTFLFGLFFWICDEFFSRVVGRILQFFLHRG